MDCVQSELRTFMAMWQHTFGVYVWRSVWRCKLDCVQFELRTVIAMWQHTFGVYVWSSVWRCKLDSVCIAFCVEM